MTQAGNRADDGMPTVRRLQLNLERPAAHMLDATENLATYVCDWLGREITNRYPDKVTAGLPALPSWNNKSVKLTGSSPC